MNRMATQDTQPISWQTGPLGKNIHSEQMQRARANMAAKVNIAALVDVATLSKMLNDISALLGITTALLDLEGNILQSAGWQRACTDFHRAVPSSCANCTESDLFLASHLKQGEFVDYKCKNGLWDIVTPVFVGELHLGNLYSGQFFYDDDVVDDAYFIDQAARFGYDESAYLSAIHAMPRFSRERVRSIMTMLVDLASYLSMLSLSNLKLQESRRQMETLINTLPDPVWLKDTNGVFMTANRAFERLIGRPFRDIEGKTDYDLCPADLAGFFQQKDREAIAAAKPQANEEWLTDAESGQAVLLETTKVALPGVDGSPIGVLGIAHNITERKQAEENLNLMSKVFFNSGEAILISDANNRILAVNREFTKLTGYEQWEVIGKDPKLLSCGNTPREVYEEMWRTLNENDHWQGEMWDRRKTGEPYPKRLSISVVRDSEGKIINYIGSFEDITDRKAAEDQIRYLAHHDALTGLPNRFSLHDRIEQSMAFARRFDKTLAVMLIDLDRFKTINDTLGHNAGDQLLIQVARRLEGSVRESDIVARIGGDEFIVVLTGVETSADVEEVAGKIIKCIAAPYRIAGHELRTTPSLGICLYPGDANEFSELIKHADIAMYHAKSEGRGLFKFYTAAMQEAVNQRATVENELETALEEGQFQLHYQPQVDHQANRVVGVEALLRWQHPVRGMIAPCDFIPLAEETRLIIPLGRWVLEEACRQLKRWHDAGLTDLHMSVNLSAVQLQEQTLPLTVRKTIQQAGLAPDYLHLEITESMAMRNPEDNIVMMKALADIGVKLAMDDFGTGYSSLAYLKLFPIDTIKIDRSFVKDIEIDDNDAAICEMTMLLAHKLGMHVIAEGVETDQQLAFLSDIGCQCFQGYRYSKPLPADQAQAFIETFGKPA